MPHQRRALIIEDDESIRDSLRLYLEQHSFVVDTAADGDKGTEMALAEPYDVVVLDNALPKKLAFQVCQEIRAHGKDIPIIVISVYSDVANKITLLQHGADDYLTKPFAPEELLARISAVFRRMDEKYFLLTIRDLTMNANSRIITKGATEVNLTRTEFAVLLFLLKNKDRAVTREAIIKNVWPAFPHLTTHTLETHVANIRRKIQRPDEPEFIHTITGVGYRLS